MTGNVISAGLIGSILTAIIMRLIDLWQRRIDHKYNLRRTFFEHKLSVAEAAISRGNILESCLSIISALLDQVIKNLPAVIFQPPEVLKNVLDSILTQFTKASAPALDPANAVPLFFDLDEFNNASIAKEVLESGILIEAGLKIFQSHQALYTTATDDAAKEQIMLTAKQTIEKMQGDIKKFSDKLEKGRSETSSVIKKIREEMKEFES